MFISSAENAKTLIQRCNLMNHYLESFNTLSAGHLAGLSPLQDKCGKRISKNSA